MKVISNGFVILLLTLFLPGALLMIGQAEAACRSVDSGEDWGAEYQLRWGEGGFKDSRSPDGNVGGGPLVLDIMACKWRFGFSLSAESYTRSPEPTENFEISDMYVFSLLYINSLEDIDKTDYFLSVGTGKLEVPDQDRQFDATLINIEAGIHWKRFERFGFYGSLKYLYAQKKLDDRKVIDFGETIFTIGVIYRFML